MSDWEPGVKEKTGNQGDTSFVDAFMTTALTICIGAMAVVGAVQDGLTGDTSTLLAKAILDMVIVLVLTVSKRKGRDLCGGSPRDPSRFDHAVGPF